MRRTLMKLFGIGLLGVSAILVHRVAVPRDCVPLMFEVETPRGAAIRTEVSTTWPELERGLRGRSFLATDAGMLVICPTTGRHRHWMFECLFPIDMIWLDSSKRVVEIAPHVSSLLCTALSIIWP